MVSGDRTHVDPGDTEPIDFDSHLLEPSSEPEAIGRVDRYHILHRVGRGGMGVVFRALDADLQRIVAVKFIRSSALDSAEARARFLREARAAAAVTHANIVTVHTIGETHGIPYLVMEFIEGESLNEKLKAGVRYQPVELLQLVLQLCEGLEAAHACGIIHRDIKPSNVLIEHGSGRAKIADFGLARLGEDQSWQSEQGAILGTPAYMSPEQVSGRTVDHRSDLFSLGCLIYASVTGRSPFSSQQFAESISQIVAHEPQPLSQSPHGVPVIISKIVSRLIEKDPQKRYQSAAEVAQEVRNALKSISEGNVLEMAETIRLTTISKPSYRFFTAVGGGLCLIALALFWTRGWWQGDEGQQAGQGNDVLLNVAELLPLVKVSQGGEAPFSSIGEALQHVEPGGTVQVLDDGLYREQLLLDNPDRHNGLTIEALRGAKIIGVDDEATLVTMQGVQDVLLRGFRLQSQGEKQQTILLRECQGIRLEDLDITQEKTRAIPAVEITQCNQNSQARALVMRDCQIESKALASGQCLEIASKEAPCFHIVVERNRFTSRNSRATNVILWGAFSQLRFSDNLVRGGYVGVNVQFDPVKVDPEATIPYVVFSNNTITSCRSWIGLIFSEPSQTNVVLVNNLIIDCETIEGNIQQIIDAADYWVFGGNYWEKDVLLEGKFSALSSWLTYQPRIGLLSRSPESADYLQLDKEASANIIGIGQPYSTHVGRHPQDPSISSP